MLKMIIILETDYSDHREIIKLIRNEVFVKGQNVPESIEIDGKDDDCKHVILIVDGMPAGTGRIEKDGHIGRVAVLEEFRGNNYGTGIMEKLEETALKEGLDQVYLNSQKHAIQFYKKLGYRTVGEYFTEAGILHKKMIKGI